MTGDGRRLAALPAEVCDLVVDPQAPWCPEQARRMLQRPEMRDRWEEAVRDRRLRPGVLALAQADVAGAADDVRFFARAEHWMRIARTTWQESAAWCADVAWQARRDGRHLGDGIPRAAGSGDAFTVRTRLRLGGLALRYDFRRVRLEETMRAHLGPWDPFSRALFAFALLGQSKPQGLQIMDEVLAAADDEVKVLHALLHGLWLGDGLPERHQHMLGLLARPPFRQDTDAVALFRKASVLREMRSFGPALATVDRALEHLAPGDAGVHGDLVRERALILAARDAWAIVNGAAPSG